MPIGTCFHTRTAERCESMSWRDWAGFFAVSSYEVHHEREYNAIRNAAALIDVSPLFKYRLTGRDATRLVDRVVTRDVLKMKPGQVAYTNWCDGRGKVIDDGTVSRLEEDVYRWTAAEPNLRWIHMNSHGLQVRIEDVSERLGALALQGPTSRAVLEACVEGADVAGLKYFRVTSGRIAGIPVDISRTGYTGDLGYEIWVPWDRGEALWDALMAAGRPYDVTPTGMLALDVARIEAGLILLDVDYVSSRKALIAAQQYTPYEIGLGRLVHLDKSPFIGQQALRAESRRGPARQLVGLEVDWDHLERLYDEAGLPPQLPLTASRLAVPVYRGGRQVGKATSSTWSPVLKKMIALATVSSQSAGPGSRLEMEVTVNHERKQVGVTVKPLPFFDPPRKRA
ncbi:MAG TPA: aminomethyltransferase family protein [Vicinamibacteria bacterium]|nr:aminomethyltransferase family protein [Vicinamibacteria bacterium]